MALIGQLKVQDNEPPITTRQTWLLIFMGIVFLLNGCAQSVLPVLFPILALSKKEKMWQIGTVFAAFQFGRIFLGHYERKLMSIVTPKFLVVTGVLFSGGTNLLLGCMLWAPGGNSFLVLNILLQIINGVGYAMTSYAVVLLVGGGAFYANSVYFIAMIDSFGLSGLISGAPIGSIIFSLSNYFTVFATIGLLLLIVAITFMAVIEDDAGKSVYPSEKTPLCPCYRHLPRQYKIYAYLTPEYYRQLPVEELLEWPTSQDVSNFLHTPLVWGYIIAVFLNSAVDSYVLITLSIELQKRQMGPLATGGMFLVTYLSACAADFSVGALVKRFKSNFIMIALGCFFMTLGLVCLGPAPFVNLKSQSGTIALGLIFKGLATGAISSSAVAGLLRSARFNLFPDDLATFIMVIKLTFGSEYFGHFLGAVVTGPLYQLVGHPNATCIFAIVFSVLIVVCTMAHCFDKRYESYINIDGPSLYDSLNLAPSHQGPVNTLNLSSSIECESGEWGWILGNNHRGVL